MDDSGAIHQTDTQIGFNAAFKNGFSIDGLGPDVGLLREYAIPAGPGCTGAIVGESYFTGYPCYKDGVTNRFNLFTVPIGYGDGTPTPIDADASWGPFGTNYQHLYSVSTTRPFGHKIVLGLEYDGSLQRAFSNGGAQLAMATPDFDRLSGHVGQRVYDRTSRHQRDRRLLDAGTQLLGGLRRSLARRRRTVRELGHAGGERDARSLDRQVRLSRGRGKWDLGQSPARVRHTHAPYRVSRIGD